MHVDEHAFEEEERGEVRREQGRGRGGGRGEDGREARFRREPEVNREEVVYVGAQRGAACG